MDLPKIHSFKVHKMLTDPKFKKRMGESVSIVKKYDVPYIAGYSKDGKTIYVDRHLETEFEGKDIIKYLVVHEKTEKALLDLFNLKYQQAHHIALHVERQIVEKDGINWDAYSKFIDKYKKNLGHEDLSHSPKDLDLEPYEDEKDYHVFLKKHNDTHGK